MISLHNKDCLEFMQTLPDNSIDFCLTDPPYGTTSCGWDSVIPFEPMWVQLRRVVKTKKAIALFCTQPFTSVLVASNLAEFKYCWTWEKGRVGGFTSAKLKPLKLFEDIAIFSDGKTANCNKNNMAYFPQGLIDTRQVTRSSTDKSKTGYWRPSTEGSYVQTKTNYPKQLIKFTSDKVRVHPTQKPVALLEYLIKTYTLEGETVLDFTMGSGSTAVACLNTGRKFVGCELDPVYFEVTKERLKNLPTLTVPTL